jgi:hypothetical protein
MVAAIAAACVTASCFCIISAAGAILPLFAGTKLLLLLLPAVLLLLLPGECLSRFDIFICCVRPALRFCSCLLITQL